MKKWNDYIEYPTNKIEVRLFTNGKKKVIKRKIKKTNN